MNTGPTISPTAFRYLTLTREASMSDKDYVYIIKDHEGNVVSDGFYACCPEEALRIAKYFYPNASTAELRRTA